MAATPFFGNRDNDPFAARKAAAGASTHASNATPAGASSAHAPHTPTSNSTNSTPAESGSKLTVGPNIKLKGVEITDCDTLVVEGTVEATMDSRVIHISEHGAFKGSAEIDIAEIHGAFDGDLTVRDKLKIFSTGKVTGKIRYGKVVIEEGGQLVGDVQCAANKPTLLAA